MWSFSGLVARKTATTLFCDHRRRLSTRNMEENPKMSERRCIPCEGGITPLHAERIEQLKKQLHPDWKIHQDPFMKLSRTFVMKNFTAALAFINKVGELAEDMGHHPDLHLTRYRQLTIEWYTHAINGLSENDFICAARTDQLSRTTETEKKTEDKNKFENDKHF